MKHLYFFLSSLFLFSCSEEAISPEGMTQTSSHEEHSQILTPIDSIALYPQRSMEEALQVALQFNKATRSGHLATKEDFEITCLSSRGIRSSLDKHVTVDTMAYILNSKSQNCSYLVSGDKRVPDLLAYLPYGTLDLDKLEPGNPIQVFLSRLPGFYEGCVEQFQEQLDSTHQANKNSTSRFSLRNGHRDTSWKKIVHTDWVYASTVESLVKVEWGQGVPYNLLAPIVNEKRPYAGCLATAIAQLASYHKVPVTCNGLSIDWKLLDAYLPNSGYEEHISTLFRFIGDNLKNKWGQAPNNNTPANVDEIPAALKALGYSSLPKKEDFNATDVIRSIDNKIPVIVTGAAEKKTSGWWIFSSDHYESGHAWICDGYMKQERNELTYEWQDPDPSIRKQTRILLHCNWGWKGSCNGYFIPGVFDSHSPVVYDSRSLVATEKPYYFQYIVRQFLNIRP